MNNLIKRILSIFFLIPVFIFPLYEGGVFFNFLIFFIFAISFYEILKLQLLNSKLIITSILFIFLYSFYNIRNQDYGLEIIFLLTFITWCSDTGGYISGKLFGGRKINFISPNKTISGFFGSIILVQLNLFYIQYFEINLFPKLYYNILFLFFCTLIVVLGDLLFSYFKRLNKIKDYSNFMPGHGGILDRLDGYILLIIVFNIIYYIK
ncbi:MAG: phosphatidate cytidylyltransferase [Candidatus Pelagibacter sp.]|nr:phosphatidate cytidylyltransferase [Candidatus Pelagibacter sp.]OUV87300.1 MAG: hypothetical protein CBC96_02420 [Pelagibacteraceae bacterium TMED136]|tara:strand:+ start:37260 stop:37883 length:624 start_codon:yes stop_codon:yes gene_type:complete